MSARDEAAVDGEQERHVLVRVQRPDVQQERPLGRLQMGGRREDRAVDALVHDRDAVAGDAERRGEVAARRVRDGDDGHGAAQARAPEAVAQARAEPAAPGEGLVVREVVDDGDLPHERQRRELVGQRQQGRAAPGDEREDSLDPSRPRERGERPRQPRRQPSGQHDRVRHAVEPRRPAVDLADEQPRARAGARQRAHHLGREALHPGRVLVHVGDVNVDVAHGLPEASGPHTRSRTALRQPFE